MTRAERCQRAGSALGQLERNGGDRVHAKLGQGRPVVRPAVAEGSVVGHHRDAPDRGIPGRALAESELKILCLPGKPVRCGGQYLVEIGAEQHNRCAV